MGIQTNSLDTGPAKFYGGAKCSGTVASTSTTITGTTTAFLTEVAVGDFVYEPVKRGLAKVTAVTNDTSLTISPAFNSNLPGGTILYVLKDLGDTKGGIDVEETTQTYTTSTDRLGTVSKVVNDRSFKVTVPFSDWKPDNFSRAIPDSLAKVASGGKTLVRFSKSVGLDLSTLGFPSAVVPILNGSETTDPNRIIVFHNLCPSDETLSLKYAATEQRPIMATFEAWPLSDGEIGYIGDNSIRP
jgi:hypothetical protein